MHSESPRSTCPTGPPHIRLSLRLQRQALTESHGVSRTPLQLCPRMQHTPADPEAQPRFVWERHQIHRSFDVNEVTRDCSALRVLLADIALLKALVAPSNLLIAPQPHPAPPRLPFPLSNEALCSLLRTAAAPGRPTLSRIGLSLLLHCSHLPLCLPPALLPSLSALRALFPSAVLHLRAQPLRRLRGPHRVRGARRPRSLCPSAGDDRGRVPLRRAQRPSSFTKRVRQGILTP